MTAEAQKTSQGPDIDITLEAQSNRRLHFLVEVSHQSEGGFVGTPSGITGGTMSVDLLSCHELGLVLE